jgi:saccharopine dehydrogenase (NAD+, L-lysine forming)
MTKFIGIRHEDKYASERRAPLTPRHVKRLVEQKKMDIVVESSGKRIFPDDAYRDAGAKIASDLKDCDVVFGVKEMPLDFFEPHKTYVFFSHVIKGQPYNMPMLKRMMELKCNLIDYEKVIDEQGKRLIFFGRYAGLAGMINSLWALGLRLKDYGYKSKLASLKQAKDYASLREAKEAISIVGQQVAEEGIPSELRPYVVAFTGYGNVSQGAQEILGWLPVKEITPEKLLGLHKRKKLPDNLIYKVVFKEEDMVERIDGSSFDLIDYYTHPEKYKSKFDRYLPYISMLVNCVYWDPKYPRLVTKKDVKKLMASGRPKLTVIGDITCDVEGSIECTLKPATIEKPLYIYDPESDSISDGHKEEGMLMMAVDILPAELPKDASESFGDVLVNFVKPIADADFSEIFEDLELPRAIKKGLILHNGELTPEYRYLERYIK